MQTEIKFNDVSNEWHNIHRLMWVFIFPIHMLTYFAFQPKCFSTTKLSHSNSHSMVYYYCISALCTSLAIVKWTNIAVRVHSRAVVLVVSQVAATSCYFKLPMLKLTLIPRTQPNQTETFDSESILFVTNNNEFVNEWHLSYLNLNANN